MEVSTDNQNGGEALNPLHDETPVTTRFNFLHKFNARNAEKGFLSDFISPQMRTRNIPILSIFDDVQCHACTLVKIDM